MNLFTDKQVAKKTCSKCGRTLPYSEFHRRRHYVRDGRQSACKDCTREATRRARAENPPRLDLRKHRVRARTRQAIRRGELIPQPCEECGNTEVEAHHPDYDAPDAHLKVRWLCEKHHSLLEGKRAWTKQMELFPAEL